MDYPNTVTPVSMADLGSIGYATIEPGTTREEQISFTGISQQNNGTALLTGIIRGLAFNPGTQGCNGSSSLAIAHAGGVQIVLSNTACFYTQYLAASNTSTITGLYTFSALAIPQYSSIPSLTSSTQFASVAYVNGVATSGAPDASQSAKGLVQIATNANLENNISTSTDGAQVLWNVVPVNQYGKTYGLAPTAFVPTFGTTTGTANNTTTFSFPAGMVSSFNFLAEATDTIQRTITQITSSNVKITLGGGQGSTVNASSGIGGLGGTMTGKINNPSTSTTYFVSVGTSSEMTFFSTTSTCVSSSVLMVAGGGGSAGTFYGGGITSGGGAGGYGGGTSGGAGANGNSGNAANGGTAGSQSSAGTGGTGNGTGSNGTNGSSCQSPGGSGGGSSGGAPGGQGGGGFFSGGGGGGASGFSNGDSGGGGGGSSFVTSTLFLATSTATGTITGNGTDTFVYSYSYTWSFPVESVTSTIVGNNNASEVTVGASTIHLNPTSSILIFAPWAFPVSSTVCEAQSIGTNLSPYVLYESATSVEYTFSSNITGDSFNSLCDPY